MPGPAKAATHGSLGLPPSPPPVHPALGALFISPADAARLHLGEGSSARIASQASSQDLLVCVNDRMQRGHVPLPGSLDPAYREADGERALNSDAPNEPRWSELRDEYAGAPRHKSVPARVEAI